MRWLTLTVALLAATASLALWIFLRDRGPAHLPATPPLTATHAAPSPPAGR
jgi:hypothetical protein